MRIEGTNLPDRWTLTPADHALVAAKSCVNQLSFAVLLLFFRERGRFPVGSSEIDRRMVERLRGVKLGERLRGVRRGFAVSSLVFGFRTA